MFGLFTARLAPRLGRVAPSARISSTFFSSPLSSNTVFLSSAVLSHKTRTFMSSAPIWFPVKKSTAAKKSSTKKKTTAGKKKTTGKTKKVAAKKKPVTTKKKKVAVKKKEVKPKIKLTPDMKPPTPPGPPQIIYGLERRKNIPSSDTLAGNVEIVKMIASEWKVMSDAEKQPYVELYQRKKEEYFQARAEWEAKVSPEILKALNRKRAARGVKKIRRHTLPKGPVTPFPRYVREYMQNSSERGKDAFRAAAESWKGLSAAQKQVYSDAYQAERKAAEEAKA